jgi:uncharacterized protein
MKLSKKQLKDIIKFSLQKIKENDTFHKKEHIKQTVKLSKILAKKEKADIKKAIVIAWLHDIEKNKEQKNQDPGKKGAQTAEKFLEKLNIPEKDIKEICYAIHQHNKGCKKKTKQAKIIWDADKLQGIGPSGLLRIYGYYIEKGLNPKIAYKNNKKEQNFFIKKFYTKTARKIAKKNYDFVKKFDKIHENLKKGNI